MSTLAKELDERLQNLDPRTAEHVERLVREVLALTEATASTRQVADEFDGLLRLAEAAEPLGAMTNAEIDGAIYGR